MRKVLAFAALAAFVVLARPAVAQLESPLLSKIQLNLVNPGGKSLAMGGAFVSVADDATAALANPAGIAQLKSWQVGASGKGFRFEPKLSTANFASSTGGGYTLFSYDQYQPQGNTGDLEFASLVGPLGGSVSVAVYRAVNLRYVLDAADLVGGNYRSFFINRGSTTALSLDEQGGIDIRNQLYGGSIGAQFDRVSLGVGLTFNKLKYELTGGALGGPHTFIVNAASSGNTDPRIDTNVSTTVESGTKVGWVVGTKIQIEQAHDVALGFVYRKAPRFDVSYAVDATFPASGRRVQFSCGVDDPNVPGSGASACGTFHVPDDFAFGLSGRISQGLLVAAEVQRIKYSQLNDGFVPLFVYSGAKTSNGTNVDRAVALGSNDDGTLLRLGAEYTIPFAGGSEMNIRVGWFREPAHGMKLDLYPDADRNRRADAGPPVELADPPFTQAYRTSFDGGEAETHYSGGIGATVARHLSIDLALDIAKTTKSFVVSAFFRF